MEETQVKETIYFAQLDEDKKLVGFYIEGLHGEDVCNQIYEEGGLKLEEALWSEVIKYGSAIFNSEKEDRVYTIEDFELFERYISPVDPNPTPLPKSQMEILQETVDQLVLAQLGGI